MKNVKIKLIYYKSPKIHYITELKKYGNSSINFIHTKFSPLSFHEK